MGNYPGRALGFVCRKAELAPKLLSYPGKSLALYGSGVIFRSDSNGEDLELFAGAGLYDSFLAEPPFAVTSIAPPDGALLNAAPTTVTIDVSDEIQALLKEAHHD